jgi:hypothetical protein
LLSFGRVRLACLAALLAVPGCFLDPHAGEDGADPSTGPQPFPLTMGCAAACDRDVVATGTTMAWEVQWDRPFTIAATCTGAPCQLPPPDATKHDGAARFEVVGLGDGELTVHVSVTDVATGAASPLHATQELRTVTGIRFACTIDQAPCPVPIPAGSNVTLTAQADAAEGPFGDPDIALAITSDPAYECLGDYCLLSDVVPGTVDITATEHDVAAATTLTVE